LQAIETPASSPASVRFGRIHAHVVTFDEALDRIVELCRAGAGGYVVTPNVDHVVLAEEDAALVDAYARAALSLVDGKPLVWLARAMGTPLPAKISGSDLARPLVARAAAEGLSVFFLGAKEGVGRRAADLLVAEHPGLKVAGVVSPPLGFEKDEGKNAEVVRAIRESGADLVVVALGAPKQELWMARHKDVLAPSVLLGLGGTLDFIVGDVKRAPPWMSDAGLEWLYRLAQEPRRMASRYLVRDRAFAGIALRSLIGRQR
jgi:N-acetylglucosaminyldiphosphoundecaprenol N-acetyl-beta-D-mannosaminyltransferase